MKNRVILFTLVAACTNPSPATQPEVLPQTKPDTPTIITEKAAYGIRINDSINLYLQQWDSTVNLRANLGVPFKDKTRKLDEHADTFSGSYIRDLVFRGISLQLFSPPGNGKTFWIQEIILTDSAYTTLAGIRPGSSLEEVNLAYPSLLPFPGTSKNMYYLADEGYEKSIEMEFDDEGRLIKLRMYYLLN